MNIPTLILPKGRLYKEIYNMYLEKGIKLPDPDTRQYWFPNYFEDCNIFIAKPKAIPNLLYSKFAEFAFCGNDIMMNSDYTDRVSSIYDTGFNEISMVIASRDNVFKNKNIKKYPIVVATEFEILAGKVFSERGIPHYILNSYGSTEGYVDIGADVIVDIVETGDTLKANGLLIDEILFKSSTKLFQHNNLCDCELPNIITTLF